jgi:hypothetical protein
LIRIRPLNRISAFSVHTELINIDLRIGCSGEVGKQAAGRVTAPAQIPFLNT